jgi:phosphatidate cytidylyltransferase
MSKRVLTALVLAAIGFPAIYYGGVFFWILIVLLLMIAAWEYLSLMRAATYQPAITLGVAGVFFLALIRVYFPDYESAALVFFIFLAMASHLIAFERGRDYAAADFAVTATGILYFGWIGSYLIKLRELPHGIYWFSFVLPIIWFTDTGAFFVGKKWGKHKMSPRLSPKKTWEGYWGGIFFGVLGSLLFYTLWHQILTISLSDSLLLGLSLSMLTPLGDLGESMMKRQSGIKDSGHILPGHGGIFDRIDTWLWAAPLGYYLIRWFFI